MTWMGGSGIVVVKRWRAMSDNLVLEMLRHIREQNDNIRADILEIKERLGFI